MNRGVKLAGPPRLELELSVLETDVLPTKLQALNMLQVEVNLELLKQK